MCARGTVCEDSVLERVVGWPEDVAVVGHRLAIELDLLADACLVAHAVLTHHAATITARQNIAMAQRANAHMTALPPARWRPERAICASRLRGAEMSNEPEHGALHGAGVLTRPTAGT